MFYQVTSEQTSYTHADEIHCAFFEHEQEAISYAEQRHAYRLDGDNEVCVFDDYIVYECSFGDVNRREVTRFSV